jgi:hypothetical protein
MPSCDETDPLSARPSTLSLEAFPPRAPTVSIIFGIINTGLIKIDPLRFVERGQLSQERLAFGCIPFLVGIGLFFRVNPMRLRARPMVSSLISSGQSWAISA